MRPIHLFRGLAITLFLGFGLCGAALAQDEPGGANAWGGKELSDGHHDGDHMGPIGPYLSAAELRNWPQGSRRATPDSRCSRALSHCRKA